MPFGRDDPARAQGFWYDGKYDAFQTALRVEQYSACKKSGKYPKLIDTWYATKAFKQANPSVEVCCYLGAVIGAPEWDANYETVDSMRKRMDDELKPYVDSGCSIGFDATGFLSDRHWFFPYLQTLKARGVKVYVEGWPYYGLNHLASENGISLTEQLVNYTPTTIGKPGGFLDPLQITGKKHVWMVKHVNDGFPAGYAEWCKKIIPALAADPALKPDHVTFYVKQYLADGGKLEDLKADPTDWQQYIPTGK
jgi:hypothetical protein